MKGSSGPTRKLQSGSKGWSCFLTGEAAPDRTYCLSRQTNSLTGSFGRDWYSTKAPAASSIPARLKPSESRPSRPRATLPNAPGNHSASAVHVPPVALFALRNPLDRLLDALLSGFRTFGFRDPVSVFALAAGAEFRKDLRRHLVFLQGGREFRRNSHGFLRRLLRAVDGLGTLAAFHQTGGLAHVSEQLAVRGQRLESRDAA